MTLRGHQKGHLTLRWWALKASSAVLRIQATEVLAHCSEWESHKKTSENTPRDESEVVKNFGESFLWNVTESWAFWESDDNAGVFPTAPWEAQKQSLSFKDTRYITVRKWLTKLTWQVCYLFLYIASHFLHAHRHSHLCKKVRKI